MSLALVVMVGLTYPESFKARIPQIRGVKIPPPPPEFRDWAPKNAVKQVITSFGEYGFSG